MFGAEKKKRSTSGTRSKSRKLKPDQSTDLKPRQAIGNLQECKSRIEDYNNRGDPTKLKPPRKLSKPKKHTKSSIKDSKDISHSVSADRKHSLTKMNKTEANVESEDLERQINVFKKAMSKIYPPEVPSVKLAKKYYEEVRESMERMNEPLYSLCVYMHQVYMRPLQLLMQILAPYEHLISEEQEIVRLINKQTIENEQIYKQLDPVDKEIFKLKEIIEQQRACIEEKRRLKEGEQREIQETEEKRKGEQGRKGEPQKLKGIRGFKLDLDGINKNSSSMGFHDQFYAKLDEFSQSWRNQAIREKRF